MARYARWLNPTFANFNLVTPYPGTQFYTQIRDQIASFDFNRYDVYTPVLKYEHLTSGEVAELHARAFAKFYFRWEWLQAHAALVWPGLRGLTRFFQVRDVNSCVPPSNGGASLATVPTRGTKFSGRSRRAPGTKGRGSPHPSRS